MCFSSFSNKISFGEMPEWLIKAQKIPENRYIQNPDLYTFSVGIHIFSKHQKADFLIP